MSKHSKFGVDIFINSFWVRGYIKINYTFDKKCFKSSKKRHNSKNISYRIMSIALQLLLVMMSKYSKFHVDIFDSFQMIILNKQLRQNFKVNKGHNFKTTAFRVMPLILTLHLVMMSKYLL